MKHDTPPNPADAPTWIDELTEIAALDPDKLSERLRDVPPGRIADLALRLEPSQRLELLLHGPKPMRAVRAVPDSEFYLTVREVGPTDALPLVALASTAQLMHLIDLEGWRRDRFDPVRCGAWIALFLESGEPTLRRFLRSADDDLLTLIVARWFRARPLEASDSSETFGREQTEHGDERGPVSPDGYYRMAPEIPEQALATQHVARAMFLDQPKRYRRIMWEAQYALDCEVEEAALRWRASRLEEHGYPPWDEAIRIYSEPTGATTAAEPPRPADPDGLRAARLPLRVLDTDDDPLGRALATLSEDSRERVMHDLVALANRLLVADGADAGHPDSHRAALRTGAGYIRIGLELEHGDDAAAVRDGLDQRPVLEWFRSGFSVAATLQAEARRMLGSNGWGREHRDAVSLLDEPLAGRVTALLEPRPQYLEFDGEGRALTRPFRSTGELDETRAALAVADAVGRLCVDTLGLDPAGLLDDAAARRDDPPQFSAAWLTLLAWHSTRDAMRGDPLPVEVLRDFIRDVASRQTAAADAGTQATERLLGRLRAGGAIDESTAVAIGGFARACLARLDAACGRLDPETTTAATPIDCLLLLERR